MYISRDLDRCASTPSISRFISILTPSKNGPILYFPQQSPQPFYISPTVSYISSLFLTFRNQQLARSLEYCPNSSNISLFPASLPPSFPPSFPSSPPPQNPTPKHPTSHPSHPPYPKIPNMPFPFPLAPNLVLSSIDHSTSINPSAIPPDTSDISNSDNSMTHDLMPTVIGA